MAFGPWSLRLPAIPWFPLARTLQSRETRLRVCATILTMLENAIPRLLGWVPISVRRALIGHPDNPSRLATFAHNFLNRITPSESHVFACQGALAGYRMSIDWSRYRSFVYGTWEPKVVGTVIDTVKAGMTVIDIGAHIGHYPLLFAKCVGPHGRIFAFEPLPCNFALLRKNVLLNNLQNVYAVDQAVFSSTREIEILVPDDQPNPGNGSMHNETKEKHYAVKAISLDDYCEKLALRPDILKMDVEGTEYEVLIGAKKTIDRCQPSLFIELHHFDGKSRCQSCSGAAHRLGLSNPMAGTLAVDQLHSCAAAPN
jgi:FkbM family methyltransferase